MQAHGLVIRSTRSQQPLSETAKVLSGSGDFQRDRPETQLLERIPSFELVGADRSPESAHRLIIKGAGAQGCCSTNGTTSLSKSANERRYP